MALHVHLDLRGLELLYVVLQIVSGHYRTVLFTPRDVRGVRPMARRYFLFGPKPPSTGQYNPLQKLAYTSTLKLDDLHVHLDRIARLVLLEERHLLRPALGRLISTGTPMSRNTRWMVRALTCTRCTRASQICVRTAP